MARVSEASIEALPEELRPLHRKFSGDLGNFTNQANVLAHSPEAFRHLYGLVAASNERGSIPRRLTEIAVLTTSRVNRCSYCVGHHSAALVDLGLGADTAERILEPEPPGLTELERLVRDYARLVTERPWGIQNRVFDSLRLHFSERQIVELTVRIALCGLFNRVNDALEIDMEEAVLADILAKNIRTEVCTEGEARKLAERAQID